jgi:hypothetical protein
LQVRAAIADALDIRLELGPRGETRARAPEQSKPLLA